MFFLRQLRTPQSIWSAAFVSFIIALAVMYLSFWKSYDGPTSSDVATSWHKQIGRYGITARFPLEEDFHVGDIYAVIASSGEAARDSPEVRGHEVPLSLEGRSLRISYINLRAEIASDEMRPSFSETKLQTDGRPEFLQANAEEAQRPPEGILLKRIAFPTIILNRGVNANGGLSNIFGGSGRDTVQDELQIPNAETYGAPPVSAGARLAAWCTDEETKLYCEDVPLRRILALAISPRVYEIDAAGNYTHLIKLQLVSRVYVTREIKIRRLTAGGGGVAIGGGAETSILGAELVNVLAPEIKSSQSAAGSNAIVLPESFSLPRDQRPRATASLALSEMVGLEAVFSKPMVFGFRAMTIEVSPSRPEERK